MKNIKTIIPNPTTELPKPIRIIEHIDECLDPAMLLPKPIRIIEQIDERLDLAMVRILFLQSKLDPFLNPTKCLPASPTENSPTDTTGCSPLIESLSATDDKVFQLFSKLDEIIYKLDL